jgi:hypothetical protein
MEVCLRRHPALQPLDGGRVARCFLPGRAEDAA